MVVGINEMKKNQISDTENRVRKEERDQNSNAIQLSQLKKHYMILKLNIETLENYCLLFINRYTFTYVDDSILLTMTAKR